jgi:hypothetical protein
MLVHDDAAPPVAKESIVRTVAAIFATFLAIYGFGMGIEDSHPYLGMLFMGTASLYLLWEFATSPMAAEKMSRQSRIFASIILLVGFGWIAVPRLAPHSESPNPDDKREVEKMEPTSPTTTIPVSKEPPDKSRLPIPASGTPIKKANPPQSKADSKPTIPAESPLTLKRLFLADFGEHTFRPNMDMDMTIGSKTNQFPPTTWHFTAQLYLDVGEASQFVGFYIPIQDRDPDEASRKTVQLCENLPDHLGDFISKLQGMQLTVPDTRGTTITSSSLTFSRRVYIYHEDFISPQALADLIKKYDQYQLLVEFRSGEYLFDQQALRIIHQKAKN